MTRPLLELFPAPQAPAESESAAPQLAVVEPWQGALEISPPVRGHLRSVATIQESVDVPAQAETEPELPLFISVAELESDKLTRERAAHFIGEVMASQVVEDSEKLSLEKPIHSLRDAIHLAAEGDEDATGLIDLCVETEGVEQIFKSGHITDPVTLEVTFGGKIIQFNQTGDDIQTNSLQLTVGHPVLEPRTKAETKNHFTDEDLLRAGWFKTHSKVVFSLADNDPDLFFTDTMSCSIQVISESGGVLQLETAFVAGISEPGAERHDLETIIRVGDMLGIDFRGMTMAQIIENSVLIKNSFIPNGAIDVVEKIWDKAASEVLGHPAFFGENKQAPCSYQKYRERCRERTKKVREQVPAVRKQLIGEKNQIVTRLQAIERLHVLTEAQMVEKAIEDHSIDVRVFGPKAALSIEKARAAVAAGDQAALRRYTVLAIETADTKSCPTALRKFKTKSSRRKRRMDESELETINEGLEYEEPTDESDEDCKEVKDGQEVQCPSCKKKVRAIVPDRESIYCSNADCKLAHPTLKKRAKMVDLSSLLLGPPKAA